MFLWTTMLLLVLALVSGLAAPLAAQELPLVASAEVLRARAAARGFSRDPGARGEVWCAAPPCAAGVDRFELQFAGGALVRVQALLSGVADGFTLDATWQASGSFGFRFTRGDERVDLTWEVTYEHPATDVAFGARRTEEVVALDPNDGAHAFALWIRRELGWHLASPQSLLTIALGSRVALRENTERALATTATVRDRPLSECLVERETPRGRGHFDTCPMRVATGEERRAVLAALDARLAVERRILQAHHRAFHRALRETLGAGAP